MTGDMGAAYGTPKMCLKLNFKKIKFQKIKFNLKLKFNSKRQSMYCSRLLIPPKKFWLKLETNPWTHACKSAALTTRPPGTWLSKFSNLLIKSRGEMSLCPAHGWRPWPKWSKWLSYLFQPQIDTTQWRIMEWSYSHQTQCAVIHIHQLNNKSIKSFEIRKWQ